MGLPILELDDIRIASPCTMRWEDMTGGDRIRFCAACQKNVFNLSGMKRSEAQVLVQSTEGKMCARFYRRADGTLLTTDCPVGVRLLARRAKRWALGGMVASLGAVGAVLSFLASTPMARVVDVEGARQAVKLQQHEIVVKHDELIVPEQPYQQIAGGLRAMPMPPPPPKQHHNHAKQKTKVEPVQQGFIMGDVAIEPARN